MTTYKNPEQWAVELWRDICTAIICSKPYDKDTAAALAIQAAFAECEAQHRETLAVLQTAHESEVAMQAKIVKLWALLDDIDTLDDACRGDDSLFRKLVRVVQQKRFTIVSGEEWDAARIATCTDVTPASTLAALKDRTHG
jgi:hypothetical protein